MAEQSWHAKLNLLRRQTPATHFLYKPHNFMPVNTLLSGLTGQRYSGCFLYMAHRFPSANIFHSGISRPAISRRPHLSLQSKFQPFVCDNFSSRRLRRRSQSYGFQPFAFFFYFFLFFCSLFFLFFFASFCFFAFFHILYHPIYRIFIFPYFFCGFLHEKNRPHLCSRQIRHYLANFFASSFAYSFVMSSSIAISYTPEYQVENLSPVHM